MSILARITSPSPEITGGLEAHSNDETMENIMEKFDACNDEREWERNCYAVKLKLGSDLTSIKDAVSDIVDIVCSPCEASSVQYFPQYNEYVLNTKHKEACSHLKDIKLLFHNKCPDDIMYVKNGHRSEAHEFCEQLDISFEALSILLDEVQRQERETT